MAGPTGTHASERSPVGERPGEVAAIDLGSNSFHLVLGKDEAGEVRILDRVKERVSLAEGLVVRGAITPAARARALDCLARFGQRLRGLDPSRVRAVGTNTFRAAEDGDAFLAEASSALGCPIEVVSGTEEARLGYAGVRFTSGFYRRRILCVDIGGGSTELALGKGRDPRLVESLRMGHVTWRELFFGGEEPLTAEALDQAVRAARLRLRSVARRFRDGGAELVVGSSGTALAIAGVIEAMGWDPVEDVAGTAGHFSRQGLERLTEALLDAGGDTAGLRGLSETRRGSLVSGVAIMRAVFGALRVERMVVSDGALREGLLSELVGRLHHHDNRDAVVVAMAERFSVDMEQAGRVASTGALLFEAVRRSWAMRRSREGLLLRWSALLHELGLSVSHDRYRRHGSYLITHADLPGFSRNEQKRLAAVVLAQRGRLRPLESGGWGGFREEVQAEILKVTLLLRVARILHRSRSSRPLPPWEPKALREGSSLTLDLGIPDAWRGEHPLTTDDLRAEAGIWSGLGHELVV